MITLATTTIPGSSNNGYVAAAYIVFFAILLIYVAIMALRLTRVERSLRELNERAGDSAQSVVAAQAGATQNGVEQSEARGQSAHAQSEARDGQPREHETA
jgi:hypothetical protein